MNERFCKTVIAASIALIGSVAHAQTVDSGTDGSAAAPDTTGSGSTTVITTSGAASVTPNAAAAGRLITRFTELAGSEQNATSLVTGLRTGSEITLTGATAGTTTPGADAVTFTAPTRPMGYGNIKIALSLAESQLAAQGITEPTPQQLQTALMGSGTTAATGTVTGTALQASTQTQGILQMRADGMGWGQIANEMGFKLGTVMSGRVPLQSAATQPATAAATAAGAQSTAAAAASAGAGSKGAVTAAGAQSAGHGYGHARRSGTIVTAAGTALGQGQPGSRAITGSGTGSAYGAGRQAAVRPATAQGGGQGNGNAYGRNK